MSDRLSSRVRRDFAPEHVDAVLGHLGTIPQSLPLGDRQDPERMQAALVLPSRGDLEVFLDLVHVAHSDWRDALVGSGLANADWADRLDDELGGG